MNDSVLSSPVPVEIAADREFSPLQRFICRHFLVPQEPASVFSLEFGRVKSWTVIHFVDVPGSFGCRKGEVRKMGRSVKSRESGVENSDSDE